MLCILQPAFVNNPIAGLIILIGLFLPDWRIGLGCLIGGSISTLTELVRITKRLVYWFFHICLRHLKSCSQILPFCYKILQIHPWQMMRNGVAAVNGVLVGTVFSALFPVVFCTERTTELWVFIVLGAFSRWGNEHQIKNVTSKPVKWRSNIIPIPST